MSAIIKRFCSMLSRAKRSEDGSVLIIFALSAMVLLGTLAMSLDFGLAYSEHDRLQKATDAAALAAATMLDGTDAEREARGTNVFKANYKENAASNFTIKIENGSGASRVVHANVKRSLQTHILPLFGYPKLDLNAETRSPIPRLLDVETVFVLDYSDSMIENQKYVRMKDAAEALIDTLSMNGENSRAKFSVVPFAAMVKANLPSWAKRTDMRTDDCTQDRRAPYNAQETPPSSSNDSRWGEVTSGHRCRDMGKLGLDVVNLTNDYASVKTKIAAMKPYMWTHIAVGAELGWQMISPSGVFGGAAAYDPNTTIKVMVLLTDGMQTAPGWGSDGKQTVQHAEDNLQALCSGMKAKGIKVFTIGYDLNDNRTKKLLESCAGRDMFYDANDIQNGLMATFSDIGERVRSQMVRLSE